jgi:hypothetical protein
MPATLLEAHVLIFSQSHGVQEPGQWVLSGSAPEFSRLLPILTLHNIALVNPVVLIAWNTS